MKISLIGLAPGRHEFQFVEAPRACGLENHPHLSDSVQIEIELEKGADNLYIRSRVRTVGHFNCDRCLKEFDLPLDDSGRVIFSSDPELIVHGDDEVRKLEANAREIDITEDLRDILLLAIPGKLICSEQCRGLCAGCGANLNHDTCHCAPRPVDERWQKLQKLLN